MDAFLPTLALVGVVIVVTALLSGWVDRTGVPQVAVFLAIGALIGPMGLSWMDATPESALLRAVATISLVLVLFTDAVSLNLREVREHKVLAGLVLGPGTIFVALLIAAAGRWILDLSWPLAAILGAAIASTDPVLLRSLLRRPRLHPSVRQALRLESGMNDIVLLPIVLVAIELATRAEPLGAGGWARLAGNILILSPAAGAAVGLAGVSALVYMRKRAGVRRDYESIYSLGLAFAAFAAAESVHGSGFLAAFAAGLTIAAVDAELCDCFLEYGETTAEMALLFAFVLFGTSTIWSGLSIASAGPIAFTAAALLLRPAALLPALIPARLTWANRALIAWFGPRGLSSLLLVMLAVFAGVPGSDYLLQVCCLVVLVSVVLHGLSPMMLLRDPVGAPAPMPAPASVPSAAPAVAAGAATRHATLTLDEYLAAKAQGQPIILVDSRTERAFKDSGEVVPGAIRLHPERAVADARRQSIPTTATLAVFCA